MSQAYFESRFPYDECRDYFWRILGKYLQRRYIPVDANVLDLGAGYCHFINSVTANNKYAVDVNSIVEDYVGENVTSIVCPGHDISPVEDGAVDVILASNIFEHLNKEELHKTLDELYRILSSKGLLLILQPNFKYCFRQYFDDFTHEVILTEVSMMDLLEAHSFTVKECHPKFLPYSFKSSLSFLVKVPLLVQLYLLSPIKPFAAQMFLVAERPDDA